MDSHIAGVCRAFYRDLAYDAGTATCPFGVELLYQRINISGRALCLYQQSDFAPRPAPAQDFPRKAKKVALDALQSTSFSIDFVGKGRVKFDRGRDLLDTLLTGRVAESIRALSHHLLTPLQGAIADADALENDRTSFDDAKLRLGRNLSQVNASAKQIQILLSDDAEFSPKKLRRISPKNIVQSLVESYAPEAESRCISLEHYPNQHSREVQAIPDQLVLVLTALVQNAVKYSFDGAADGPRRVRVTYDSDGENLVIRVQNEGCRIEEDEIRERRILELGYRGRHSTDRGRTGTGTGLYIADKIVKAHHARLEVTSQKIGNPSQPEFQAYRNTFSLFWPVYSPLTD